MCSVLVGEADHRAVGCGTCRTAGIGEQHQCRQPGCFGLVGHQLDEDPAETDGLRRQIDTAQVVARCRCVSFVEDEVDGGEHGSETVGKLRVPWDAVRGVVVAQLAFGSHDPRMAQRRWGAIEPASPSSNSLDGGARNRRFGLLEIVG